MTGATMDKESALVVVDVQNDFCPGGALPVPEGDTIIPILNRYMELFQRQGLPIIASRDWHPEKTTHFKIYGGIWPTHCVQGTKGAEFHANLQLPEGAIVVSKGMDPEKDDYSALHGTTEDSVPVPELLRQMGIRHLYVGGLATDYCVKETVLVGLNEGFKVTLLRDACRGVDLSPGDSARAVEDMKKRGAEIGAFDVIA